METPSRPNLTLNLESEMVSRMLLHQTRKGENYEPLLISSVIVQPLVSNSIALIHIESSGGRFFHLTKCSRWSFFLVLLVTLLSRMAPNFNGCVTSVQVGIYISSAFAENFLSVL